MIQGVLVGALVGTVVLTTVLRAASERRPPRIDLPFLLVTAVTVGRLRANGIGYALHFLFGLLFALGYYVVFTTVGESGLLLGAALGLLHGLFACSALVNVLLPLVHPRLATGFDAAGATPLLETPGFLLLNYGRQTPTVTLVAHVLYGGLVGGFAAWSG